MTVLLVHPDAGVLATARHLVEHVGARVLVAASRDEVAGVLRCVRVDLVVSEQEPNFDTDQQVRIRVLAGPWTMLRLAQTLESAE